MNAQLIAIAGLAGGAGGVCGALIAGYAVRSWRRSHRVPLLRRTAPKAEPFAAWLNDHPNQLHDNPPFGRPHA